ncbi:tRNA lysidine(34) synthetase TilS [Cytophagaceae bacterium DM2B3-1]|uniref:tRNA(Ile)-lysidine synthase n=1 Tax=Xanthocytophaga flava TaxID=3048013 RepID=A0ABT7CI04_9BACT|nr:tRNA lysidine(34) synthetase TilS [Xanthocytophaga flavus]MDJ1466639.1 tRNA lysidine(34) synthetase TilS [Xanthocytophaga flavus]MDJ1492635.1 tRNA lysidine(34) synthetase TilS [Xanthocytophaga flavus]
MLKKFLTYINEKTLFQPDEKVLLAVSGGMDSVVMLHLFYKAKLNFAVAHCNFGLRGEESDADEQFVKKLAKKYKVPFYSEQFDTEAFALQEKVSIQMAARVLRYEWFEGICKDNGFSVIATAHHLNDTLETVLFNLTKGTGIAGLHGIQSKNGRIARPLLFANREEIYEYVVENQLAWREDSSNQSSHYHRNLIRNEVIPLLKTINPNLEHTIEHTVDRVLAVEKVFLAEVEKTRAVVMRQEGGVTYINFEKLQAEIEPVIKLHELLKPFHFTYTQVNDIWQTLGAESGKQFDSPSYRLIKDRTELVITAKGLQSYIPATIDADSTQFQNEVISLSIQKVSASGFKIPSSPKIAALDLATLKFPLKIRLWKQGDKFCPLGMKQKKKVSDFLIDEKVPVNIKERTYVLLSGEDIVWIVGMRIDDRFKLTKETTEVYQISLER